MRMYLLIIIALVINNPAFTQSENGIEQYYFRGPHNDYQVIPVVHFKNEKNWYAEARCNYEDAETFSFYLGKTFSREALLTYSFTPLLGGVTGKFNGVSTGVNMELEYNNFFFSSQSQYSFSTGDRADSFLYSWSEIGYQPLSWLYGGLSVQQTRVFETRGTLEPGILAGFSFRRFSLPLYCFSPQNNTRYFIIGFNYDW